MADCPDIVTTTITDKTTGSTSTRSYEEVVEDAQSTLCNVLDADFLAKGVAAGLQAESGAQVGQLQVDPLVVEPTGPLTVTLGGDALPNNDLVIYDPVAGTVLSEVSDWTYSEPTITFTGTKGITNGSAVTVVYTKDGVVGVPAEPIEPEVTAGDIVSEELTLTVNALILTETPLDPLGVLLWYGGVKMDNALVIGGTGDYTVSSKTVTTIATGVIPDGSTVTVVYQKAA